MYREQGRNALLEIFRDYRDADAVTTAKLYLREYAEGTLEESFSDRSLDMIWEGGSDSSTLHLYGEYETHCYDTTLLQYIGFNFNRIAFIGKSNFFVSFRYFTFQVGYFVSQTFYLGE